MSNGFSKWVLGPLRRSAEGGSGGAVEGPESMTLVEYPSRRVSSSIERHMSDVLIQRRMAVVSPCLAPGFSLGRAQGRVIVQMIEQDDPLLISKPRLTSSWRWAGVFREVDRVSAA